MTDPIVVIEPTELSAEPGGQARIEVTVRNPGNIVENYRIEVVSEVPGNGPDVWAQVFPEEVSVYPKEKGTAIVVLSPPAGADAMSGSFPFGIRAVSTVADDVGAVAEGDIEVGRVFGLQATITPTTSSGRWRGRHVLTYRNWGNSPVRLRLKASDPDQKLGFLLRPEEVELPLGGAATAGLTVRTRKPFLRGTPVRLPFEVVAEQDRPPDTPAGPPPPVSYPGDPTRPVLNAALNQKPILSRATVAIALLAVVAAAAAVFLALKSPKHKAAEQASSLPNPPAGVAANVKSATEIDISWQLIPNVPMYQVITVLAGKNQDSAKVSSPTQVYVAKSLDPNTLYCFGVQSIRDATHASSMARLICRRTLPAPGQSGAPSSGGTGASGGSSGALGQSGGPSSGGASSGGASSGAPSSGGASSGGSSAPSGSAGASTGANGQPLFGPDDYVVLIGQFRGANAQQNATTEKFKVSSQGFTPDGILNTADYSKMTVLGDPVINPFWAAYAGPFDSNTARTQQTNCVNLTGDNCVVAKPNG